jgi:hypothetical protein
MGESKATTKTFLWKMMVAVGDWEKVGTTLKEKLRK